MPEIDHTKYLYPSVETYANELKLEKYKFFYGILKSFLKFHEMITHKSMFTIFDQNQVDVLSYPTTGNELNLPSYTQDVAEGKLISNPDIVLMKISRVR